MKAGALFKANGDASPDPAAVASGLLALTQLDREDLAVALLVDLWDQKPDAASAQDVRVRSVSHETAILVLDAALSSMNANAELVAAELLCRNADRLDICQSLHWPASIDGRWNARFGVKTKVLIVDALVHMAVKGEASLNALQSLAVRLHSIAALDPGVHVKGCVGMLLEAIVPALDRMDVRSLMQGPTEITIDDIRRAATHAHANPDRVFYKVVHQRSVDLAAWSNRCSACDFRRGALAATAVSATGPRDAESPPVALAG
jgi:hypothetical protein